MSDGDTYELGTQRAEVLFTPGHTRGHVVYFFPDAEGGNGGGALFAGDTLFALGCGRLFEGTPAQMWASLQKLERLTLDFRGCSQLSEASLRKQLKDLVDLYPRSVLV